MWLLVLLLVACSTTPPPPDLFEPPVYPAAPDEPRFIFERTLRFNSNVEKPQKQSWLRRLATGGSEEIRGLVKPFAVAVNNGRIYVTDTVQRSVILFDIPGQRYREFGRYKPGALATPTALDISPLGELFVADVSARRITVFNSEGQFLRHISGPSLLRRPSGVCLAPNGERLYVVDTGGVDSQAHHLHIFDTQSGELIKTVGKRGSKEGEFNLPLQCATAPDGTVHVVDKGNFRVQSFDAEGTFKQSFGTIGRYPGQFFSPKGIASDNDGNIYVVDTSFGNLQIFNAQGQLLMVLGARGNASTPGNYMLPAGVDVDSDGRIYITDQFFRKVDIFRPIDTEQVSPTEKQL